MKKIFQNKKWLMINYVVMALWLAAVLIINQNLVMAPWTLILAFFGLLAVPGFALARLLKIEIDEGFDRLMIWLASGLVFALIFCTIAMILGWSVFVLAWAYLGGIAGLLVISFVIDLRRKMAAPKPFKFNWRQIFDGHNLGYLAVILVAAVVVIGIGIQGTLFRGGDANFHLGILRKTFEGSSLAPRALSFIKSDAIHVAYGLPIWHIFLGLITRLTQSDTFLLWKIISMPLSIFAILVWYWLAKLIFNSRFMAFVSLAIFLNYIFNWNTGYLFTVLPLPDTLNNYLCLPLAVALFLKYVFGPSASLSVNQKFGDLKILGILSIFALLMANIHITQYLYLMIMLGLFGVLWLAVAWRSKDFKPVLIKIGLALGVNLLVFLPFLAFVEVKNHLLSKVLVALWNAHDLRKIRYIAFNKLNYFGKWALLVVIPALIFVKKHRAILFLPLMYLFLALTFIPWVSHFLIRVFGYIFVNRIFGSVIWHFLVLALVYGFMVLILDRALHFLPKLWRWAVNIVFLLALGALVWAEVRFKTAGQAYEWLFSKPVDNWFNAHYLWVIGVLAVLTIAILILQWRRPKTTEFFKFFEPQNGLMASAFLIALMVILFGTTYSYGWDYTKMTLKRPFIFQPVSFLDFRSNESHIDNVTRSTGGQAMLDFVRANLPVKSVFLVPGGVVSTLPTLLDQYMVAYPKKKLLLKTQELYNDEKIYSLEEAIEQLKKAKVDYILLTDAPDQNQAFFDKYPDKFQKIFEEDSAIYKVIP